ncbi:hypothetical protein SAMN04487982_104435 [Streptomyces sp. ok210]|nr:hypothetical protein SAMN04487982_104435 [Streptomyces sp. ok210]
MPSTSSGNPRRRRYALSGLSGPGGRAIQRRFYDTRQNAARNGAPSPTRSPLSSCHRSCEAAPPRSQHHRQLTSDRTGQERRWTEGTQMEQAPRRSTAQLDFPPDRNGLDYLVNVVDHLDENKSEVTPRDVKYAVLHLQAAVRGQIRQAYREGPGGPARRPRPGPQRRRAVGHPLPRRLRRPALWRGPRHQGRGRRPALAPQGPAHQLPGPPPVQHQGQRPSRRGRARARIACY